MAHAASGLAAGAVAVSSAPEPSMIAAVVTAVAARAAAATTTSVMADAVSGSAEVAAAPLLGAASPRSLVVALVDAINVQDAAAVGALFHAEADCVTSFRAHLRGRPEIQAGHAAAFEGPMRGVHVHLVHVDESALSDTQRLLQVQTTRTHKADADVAASPPLKFQRAFATMTAQRGAGGRWLLMALSNVGVVESDPIERQAEDRECSPAAGSVAVGMQREDA